MLHVTTEVGKPGVNEREKRHFASHNKSSLPIYHARGRRYIPHSYGMYDEWKPHPENIDVKYTENGPDWSSRLRYIPAPSNEKYPAMEIWPNNWRSMRPFPNTYYRSENEWLLDPDLTNVGLRCVFDGTHKATAMSDNEITHQMRFGKGRMEDEIEKRNGIDEAAPGDKSYQVSEYSPSFHTFGSTRPVPIFGAHKSVFVADTFVPLESHVMTRERFKQKEVVHQTEQDIAMVKKLDEWKPAMPLVPIPLTDDYRR